MASLHAHQRQSNWIELLTQPTAPTCTDHLVQFYESDAFLAEAVTQYVGAGLRGGEAAIIVATASHVTLFLEGLEQNGHDVGAALASGQLTVLDAFKTLPLFMEGQSPDPVRFRRLVGGMIETRRRAFGAVRAYGEMVDLLRAEGNSGGMLALERLWNEWATSHAFSLLCGYETRGFASESQSAAFEAVCGSHSHVLPSESWVSLPSDQQIHRTIANLERRAAALDAEIEERKRIEVALRESERTLREAVRARDEFLSIASHELKTPITSLILQAQTLQRRCDRSETPLIERKHVEKLVVSTHRQLSRLDKLVDDMLDISRIANGRLTVRPEAVDLGELVQNVIERFAEPLKAHGCRLRLTVESSIVGNWDAYRLEQVLSNLITNALKYAAGKPIEISVTAEGDRARVEVRDQGPGISPENRERVFQRFERAISACTVSGLGLGLYICRQIVEAHRGRIWAEDSAEGGATFVVELPLVDPAESDAR